MFGAKKKRGLGMTAATGLAFDPEIRRAAAHAAGPVGRLGYTLGKRMASQQLEEAGNTFSHLASLLTAAGPQLAEQLHLSEPKPRHRRLVPAVGAAAVVLVAVILATDPARRRRVQRLIVH